MISARKAKQLDATTMFTYSHANTPLGQSERAYYLSYFIKDDGSSSPFRTIIQSGKAQVQVVGGHAAEDQKQIRIYSWWIHHLGSVLTKFYSCDSLIQSIIY